MPDNELVNQLIFSCINVKEPKDKLEKLLKWMAKQLYSKRYERRQDKR